MVRAGAVALVALLFTIAPPEAIAAKPAALVKDAAAFMESYARDLAEGNRVDVAERYHPEGAYFLGHGQKIFRSHAAIASAYKETWQPPVAFEWRDLSYELVGSSGVLVLGQFQMTPQQGHVPLVYSYSGLLLVVDGHLKIRAEDESRAEGGTR